MRDRYAMSQEENIFCAKRILVDSVYKQANLEGIGVTFADTQDILNDVNVGSLTPTEISKVCCLRDGWKYLLEHLSAPEDFVCMQELHEIVARFDVDYRYLGKFRSEDVLISGTQWRPSLPDPDRMWEEMQKILSISGETDRAVTLGLWIMRTQPFKDGNKRIGSFLINKILIEHGRGIFNVPVELDGTFKQKLVGYYESGDPEELKAWIGANCLTGTTVLSSDDENKAFSKIRL